MSRLNINQLDRYSEDELPKKQKIKRKKKTSIYKQDDNDNNK